MVSGKALGSTYQMRVDEFWGRRGSINTKEGVFPSFWGIL